MSSNSGNGESHGYSELKDLIQASNETRRNAEEQAAKEAKARIEKVANEQLRIKIAKEKELSEFIVKNFGESIRKTILDGETSGTIVLQNLHLGVEINNEVGFTISGSKYDYDLLKQVLKGSGLEVSEINHGHRCQFCHNGTKARDLCTNTRMPLNCGSIVFPSDGRDFQSEDDFFILHYNAKKSEQFDYPMPLETILKSGLEPFDFPHLLDRHFRRAWDRIFEPHLRDDMLTDSELKGRLSSWENAKILCDKCFQEGKHDNDCRNFSVGNKYLHIGRVKALQICYLVTQD